MSWEGDSFLKFECRACHKELTLVFYRGIMMGFCGCTKEEFTREYLLERVKQP